MAIARKFKRTNVLQLLRIDPDDRKDVPSPLEGLCDNWSHRETSTLRAFEGNWRRLEILTKVIPSRFERADVPRVAQVEIQGDAPTTKTQTSTAHLQTTPTSNETIQAVRMPHARECPLGADAAIEYEISICGLSSPEAE
jgi:hypothetical protein